ncbi:MAG: hypothetical protein JWQ97_925 [Phenylobacterium sp.]|nr:hypothetical protein [Phenylobacterium sp.]
MTDPQPSWTLFSGERRLANGPLAEVALAALAAPHDEGPVLAFDDLTGRVADLDLRGSPQEVAARYAPPAVARPRGRPKLGVVAREVTLLPRHWEWLAAQPGGASVALRRLVDQVRREGGGETDRKARQEAAYHFMSSMAGDLPGYEEAIRALFAEDRERVAWHTAKWPADVRDHALKLAWR